MAPRACAVAARCTREKALSVGTYIECCVVHGRNRRMLSFVGTRSTCTFMEGMKSLPHFFDSSIDNEPIGLESDTIGLNEMWPVGQGDCEKSFFTASLKCLAMKKALRMAIAMSRSKLVHF